MFRIVKVELEWSEDENGALPRSVVLKIPSHKNMQELSEKSEDMKAMMEGMEFEETFRLAAVRFISAFGMV